MTDEAETYDAGDAEAERNIRRDESRRIRQDRDVVRHIMRNKEGRDWLYRKLEEWHINGQTFFPGQPDTTAFRLGEQNCAKRLEWEARESSLDLYLTMLKEQKDEERRLDNLRREERIKREAANASPTVDEAGIQLSPPAGWPGGPPLPVKPQSES